MQPYLAEGWCYLRCIDRHTWIAIREVTDESGATERYTVRYELYPHHGVYKLDYRAGLRSPIQPRELAQFYSAVEKYNEILPRELKEGKWQYGPMGEGE